ncbi:Plant invertase/pectin methylesterase inhibitor superfamily protein [Forsythia ovata]|uniref:Plant invertase/pectin methylesterase inhibitor superfamily protein n=1 Tax=Forsythia ovata TaxID=205694 RepID=A0ABD1TAY0_9LAMI
MAAYFSKIPRQVELHAADPRAASALQDCCTLFDGAVHLIRDSLKQMGQLRGSGESLRFQISNIQTWMSAALTNEDTCEDGFEGVPEGKMKTDVCDKAVMTKQMTSNALAFPELASNVSLQDRFIWVVSATLRNKNKGGSIIDFFQSNQTIMSSSYNTYVLC